MLGGIPSGVISCSIALPVTGLFVTNHSKVLDAGYAPFFALYMVFQEDLRTSELLLKAGKRGRSRLLAALNEWDSAMK